MPTKPTELVRLHGHHHSHTLDLHLHVYMYFIALIYTFSSVVQPGSRTLKSLVKEFGTKILMENGELNRVVLGEIIFSDPIKRRRLNQITHPGRSEL